MRLYNKGKSGSIFTAEIIAVLIVVGLFMATSSHKHAANNRTIAATALGQQLTMINKASQNFLDTNSVILREELEDKDYLIATTDSLTDNNNAPLTINEGIKNGLKEYLPIEFNQTKYKQDVRLYIYKNEHDGIFGLMSTVGGIPQTGSEAQKKNYVKIAKLASQVSGFGMYIDKDLTGKDIGKIVGQNDSWRFSLNDSDYGNIPSSAFQHGQLAKPLQAYGAVTKDDLLYRVEIEGRPELNAMQTDLHMNGWEITDVGTITISQKPAIQGSGEFADVPDGGNGLIIEPYITTGDVADSAEAVCEGLAGGVKPDGFIFTVGALSSDGQTKNDLNGLWMCMNDKARLISDSQNSTAIKGMTIARHGETIQKPKCAVGTRPVIYVSQVAFAEGQKKPGSVIAVQSLAEDKGNEWRIKIRVKTTNHKGYEDIDGQKKEWAWSDEVSSGGMPHGAMNYNFALVQTACERDKNNP